MNEQKSFISCQADGFADSFQKNDKLSMHIVEQNIFLPPHHNDEFSYHALELVLIYASLIFPMDEIFV